MTRAGLQVVPIYLVKPLVLGRPLQNSFHDALQLINCGGLFGIGEDGRLMTSDHKKHILGAEQRQGRGQLLVFVIWNVSEDSKVPENPPKNPPVSAVKPSQRDVSEGLDGGGHLMAVALVVD